MSYHLRMIEPPDDDSYEEEPVVLESSVKAALNVLGRNKSPRVDGIPTELLQARDWICQHPNKNMSTKMENRATAYSLETFGVHPSLQEGRCPGVQEPEDHRPDFPCKQSDAQSDAAKASALYGARDAGCSGWIQKRDTLTPNCEHPLDTGALQRVWERSSVLQTTVKSFHGSRKAMGCSEKYRCTSAPDRPDTWPVLWTGSRCQDRLWTDRMVSCGKRCQTRVHFISLRLICTQNVAYATLGQTQGGGVKTGE